MTEPRKPREFHVNEFKWHDGTITFTAVHKDHPDAFLVREITEDDVIETGARAGNELEKFLDLKLKLDRTQCALGYIKRYLKAIGHNGAIRKIEAIERGK